MHHVPGVLQPELYPRDPHALGAPPDPLPGGQGGGRQQRRGAGGRGGGGGSPGAPHRSRTPQDPGGADGAALPSTALLPAAAAAVPGCAGIAPQAATAAAPPALLLARPQGGAQARSGSAGPGPAGPVRPTDPGSAPRGDGDPKEDQPVSDGAMEPLESNAPTFSSDPPGVHGSALLAPHDLLPELPHRDPPRDKRLRTTILPEQLDILYRWYVQDSNPTRKMLDCISEEVGLKKRVVQVWFQNTRARERKGQFRCSASTGIPPIKTSPSSSLAKLSPAVRHEEGAVPHESRH
uniref:Homeobox domain-containing protein n=1 Tax=Terrapene triunguis TaxID=2587831 RepID=A0A674JTN0_9SAUR